MRGTGEGECFTDVPGWESRFIPFKPEVSAILSDSLAQFRDLNLQYGVIENVDDLRGWHLVEAKLSRPGTYRITTSRFTQTGAESRNGFASQKLITTARELGYLSAPSGYTLP